MRPSARLLLLIGLGIALLTGCGDTDDQPSTVATTPAANVFHTVANDMRDIAALTHGECANRDALQRAMGRLKHDADQLPDGGKGAKAQKLVDQVLAETRDTLASCR